MTTLVRARGFSLKYPYATEATLRDLTVDLRRGERVLLLGSSGSGKSSLALCLNGLIPHSIEADVSGSLQVFGQETVSVQSSDLARRIGIVFQDPESQFCTLTVEDEIAFGLENLSLSRDEIDRRIDRSLRQVGMARHRDTRLDRLSGGMKQRVVLAAALAMDPDLLILDEPTANLDPAGAAELFALVEHLARNDPARTFLIVEHRLDPLIEIISRVWVLGEEGRLLHDSPPRPLFTQQGALLAEMGVWQPAATSLAHALRQANVAPTPSSLTMPEVLAWLSRHPQAWDTAARWAYPGADPGPDPHAKPVIVFDHVAFTYGDGTHALQDVNLSVRRGEVLAVVGANGAGKSTLVQLVVGLLHPQQGTVRVLGEDIAGRPVSLLAQRCGFVFQNPEHQFVTDCVFDEIAFGLRRQGLVENVVVERTRALLRRLHLAEQEMANPFTLSQGEKRRLSVATMLAAERPILILDEPTFGQDARSNRELVAALRRLNRAGMTLLLVTHDMELVWTLAQRAAVMADGQVLKVAGVAETFSDAALLRRAHLQPPPHAVVAAALTKILQS